MSDSNTSDSLAVKTARLTGDTYRFREILRRHGWRWDHANKCWSKSADWESAEEVIKTVRLYGGICNRGTFTATIE